MARRPAAARRPPVDRACPEPSGPNPDRTYAGTDAGTDAGTGTTVVRPLPAVERRARPSRTGPPRRPRPSRIRRSVGALGVLLLVAVFALALAVAVVPAAAGGSTLTVLTPSMAPTYPVGALVVTRPRPPELIRVGDVVSYTDRDPATGSSRTVTHRVVGIDPGPVFRTKGDANADPDPEPVVAADVRGVAWYALPGIGGWGIALRDGPGLFVGFGAVLMLVVALLLVPRRRR